MRGLNWRAYNLGREAYFADPERAKNLLTVKASDHGLSPKAGRREVTSFNEGFSDAKKGINKGMESV